MTHVAGSDAVHGGIGAAMSVQTATIETRDPRSPGPAALVALPLADRHRPRHGVDPRRARGDDRRLGRLAADRSRQRDPDLLRADRHRRRLLRRRRLLGALFFGQLTDRFGRKKLFLITLAGLHRGHRRPPPSPSRPGTSSSPLLHRRGHRRRVRGDQLGDRRADPRPGPRPRRPDHQRLLLDRLGRRIGRRAAVPRHLDLRRRPRLAAGLRPRRGARPDDPARPPQRPREPALAVHPRPRGRGRANRRRHRGRGPRGDRRGADRARHEHQGPPAQGDPVPRDRPHRLQALPASARSSASPCSSARPSSTTASPSTSARCSRPSSRSPRRRCRSSSSSTRSATSSAR